MRLPAVREPSHHEAVGVQRNVYSCWAPCGYVSSEEVKSPSCLEPAVAVDPVRVLTCMARSEEDANPLGLRDGSTRKHERRAKGTTHSIHKARCRRENESRQACGRDGLP